MSYFDLEKETDVIVDAFSRGLGAILSQRDPNTDDIRIVAYASRALMEIEQHYSQTEREALAIVFACEHFRLFLYGIHFTLYTDHKPLGTNFWQPTVPNSSSPRTMASSAAVYRFSGQISPWA